MRRAIASSLLSLLLLTTLMWGGCISCEQYFMLPGVKSCCAPDGHCKTPAKQKSQAPECRRIAFDHNKPFQLHIDLPVRRVAVIHLAPPTDHRPAAWRNAKLFDPSPPDLQLLHAVFLI